MRRRIVGVMGPGAEGTPLEPVAFALGQLIARSGWMLLTGGRGAGVMSAAGRGAKTVPGSLVVGVLPDDRHSADVSDAVDIAVFTGMGHARNVINVLSSDVIVALGAATPGTASEIALALKVATPVILLDPSDDARRFFAACGSPLVSVARDPADAVEKIQQLFASPAS